MIKNLEVNNMNRCGMILLIFCCFLLFNNCSSDLNDKCVPQFFNKRNVSNSELNQTFSISSVRFIEKKKLCGYDHKFIFWYGNVDTNNKPIPYFELSGQIYFDSNVVHFQHAEGAEICYFDFRMRQNEEKNIDLWYFKNLNETKKIKLSKKYKLILEDKFIDKTINDTIYAFRFKGIGITIEDDDLVFFVNPNYGVMGIYNGVLNNTKEEIFSFKGNIYESRYKNKKYLIKGKYLG